MNLNLHSGQSMKPPFIMVPCQDVIEYAARHLCVLPVLTSFAESNDLYASMRDVGTGSQRVMTSMVFKLEADMYCNAIALGGKGNRNLPEGQRWAY